MLSKYEASVCLFGGPSLIDGYPKYICEAPKYDLRSSKIRYLDLHNSIDGDS